MRTIVTVVATLIIAAIVNVIVLTMFYDRYSLSIHIAIIDRNAVISTAPMTSGYQPPSSEQGSYDTVIESYEPLNCLKGESAIAYLSGREWSVTSMFLDGDSLFGSVSEFIDVTKSPTGVGPANFRGKCVEIPHSVHLVPRKLKVVEGKIVSFD